MTWGLGGPPPDRSPQACSKRNEQGTDVLKAKRMVSSRPAACCISWPGTSTARTGGHSGSTGAASHPDGAPAPATRDPQRERRGVRGRSLPRRCRQSGAARARRLVVASIGRPDGAARRERRGRRTRGVAFRLRRTSSAVGPDRPPLIRPVTSAPSCRPVDRRQLRPRPDVRCPQPIDHRAAWGGRFFIYARSDRGGLRAKPRRGRCAGGSRNSGMTTQRNGAPGPL